MHPTQLEILDSLRQGTSRQFNELLHDVAETSDNLTYHLKQLQKVDFIDSPNKGEYRLAQQGLKYLNNNLELNHDLFPTVSCMLELHGPEGKVLVMRKRKQPYLGSLHLPTFGVTSSTSLSEQIASFVYRYNIIASNPTFKCVYRKRTQTMDGLLTFDKFFLVFQGNFTQFSEAAEDRQFLALTPTELKDSDQTLPATTEVLELSSGSGYAEILLT